MRKLDELHLNYPFAGSRMLRDLLRQQDVEAGRLHIASLMKEDGHRSDLSQEEHVEARARTQDLPVSAARRGGDEAEPGMGDGHQL